MKFTERIMSLLVKPDEAMKDITNEPRIEEALVVVGIYAILVMLYTYVTTSHIKYIYNIPGADQMAGFQTITTIITLVFGLLAPLIAWVVISGGLHLFSMAFGGSGKFYPHILTSIGYSELVKIFAVIVAILLLTQAPVITVELSSSSLTAATSAAKELYSNPFYILSNLVMLIGLLWSCYLGALAMKHGEKLSMTSALIVVGVPLVIYVVISYGSMLLSFI